MSKKKKFAITVLASFVLVMMLGCVTYSGVEERINERLKEMDYETIKELNDELQETTEKAEQLYNSLTTQLSAFIQEAEGIKKDVQESLQIAGRLYQSYLDELEKNKRNFLSVIANTYSVYEDDVAKYAKSKLDDFKIHMRAFELAAEGIEKDVLNSLQSAERLLRVYHEEAEKIKRNYLSLMAGTYSVYEDDVAKYTDSKLGEFSKYMESFEETAERIKQDMFDTQQLVLSNIANIARGYSTSVESIKNEALDSLQRYYIAQRDGLVDKGEEYLNDLDWRYRGIKTDLEDSFNQYQQRWEDYFLNMQVLAEEHQTTLTKGTASLEDIITQQRTLLSNIFKGFDARIQEEIVKLDKDISLVRSERDLAIRVLKNSVKEFESDMKEFVQGAETRIESISVKAVDENKENFDNTLLNFKARLYELEKELKATIEQDYYEMRGLASKAVDSVKDESMLAIEKVALAMNDLSEKMDNFETAIRSKTYTEIGIKAELSSEIADLHDEVEKIREQYNRIRQLLSQLANL